MSITVKSFRKWELSYKSFEMTTIVYLKYHFLTSGIFVISVDYKTRLFKMVWSTCLPPHPPKTMAIQQHCLSLLTMFTKLVIWSLS